MFSAATMGKRLSIDQVLPQEILESVYVYAQNQQLGYTCRIFRQLSLNLVVRARFLFARFGSNQIFDPQVGLLGRHKSLLSSTREGSSGDSESLLLVIVDLLRKRVPNIEFCFYFALECGWVRVCRKLLLKVIIAEKVGPKTVFYLCGGRTKPSHKPAFQHATKYLQDGKVEKEHEKDVQMESSSNSSVCEVGFDQVDYITLDNTLGNFSVAPLVDINAGDAIYLRKAISACQIEVLELLLTCHRYTVVIDFVGETGYALGKTMEQVYTNHYTLHQKLDVNAANGEPLCLAVRSYSLEMAKMLVFSGADIRIDNSRALRSSVHLGDRALDLTEYLLSNGADVHAMNESCLLQACYKGDGDVSSDDDDKRRTSVSSIANGQSPFQGAQSMYKNRYNKATLLKTVAKNVTNTTTKNQITNNPSFQANSNSSISSKSNSNSSINSKSNSNSYLKTVELLLDYGANVNYFGSLPLLYAVSRGHYRTCKLLLSKGADVFAQNCKALKTATALGRQDIIALVSSAMER